MPGGYGSLGVQGVQGASPGSGRAIQPAKGLPGAPKGKPAAGRPVRVVGKAPKPAGRPVRVVNQPAKAQPFNILNIDPTKYATQTVQSSTNAALQPYQQQYKDIQGTQNTVLGRLGQYQQATNTDLGNLSGQAQDSAKTASNQLADAAKRASDLIAGGQHTIDQNLTQGALSGGAQGQVAGEMGADRARGGAQAAGAAAFAGQAGQNTAGLLGEMRGVGDLKGQEQGRDIANVYARQLVANQAQQGKLTAAMPGEIQKYAQQIGQQQFTDKATLAGLNIKSLTANTGAARQQSTAKYQQQQVGLGQQRISLTAANDQARNQIAQGNLSERQRHNLQTEAQAAQNALDRARGGGGKPLTPRENLTISGSIRTAQQVINSYRKAGNPDSAIRQWLAAGQLKDASTGKTVKLPQVKDPLMVQAAYDLVDTGHLSTGTAQQLREARYTYPSQWRPLSGGSKAAAGVGSTVTAGVKGIGKAIR